MSAPQANPAALARLLGRVRNCRECAHALPHDPRPVLRASVTARLMIVGQAPGTRVHETGIPFNDPSGDTLRAWLGIDRAVFYDCSRIAIVPTGFCYPGKGKSGDAPPRPECAPLWHPKLRPLMPGIELTLLIGAYAQAYYLGDRRQKTLAATVRNWRDYLPDYLPTPHPSPRNKLWLKKSPWFEAEVVPELRARVARILGR
ncbi:MAG: uracil-DNA glycosylase family protein [Alphaproteobacteria bacterium]|nr:uracil-DNA glycosylase family protein [Alphaproteobacteria bacterium]